MLLASIRWRNLAAWSLAVLGLGIASAANCWAETPKFEQILPILQKHCSDCHGSEEPEAELNLTTADGLLRGARSGYVVTPGKADASLLTQLLAKGSKPHMPPEGQLSADEIAAISSWIGGLPKDSLPDRPQLAKGKDHWAFKAPTKPKLPEVDEKMQAWSANPVDLFIAAKLKTAGLEPSPEVSRELLLRRACIDLIGLPPSPADVEEFLADRAPDAYEQQLDRLLASPAYGERWGRHWLDLARYADSGGFHEDIDRPFAWKYRDYVIRSLNEDKPYTQFVREQLAGDELPGSNADSLAATAFCRNGPTNDDNMGNNAMDREKYRLDLLDDVISTTSSVYLGLTVGCARCHDHKFDPLPQSDYYQLLAVFNNVTRKDVPLDDQGAPQFGQKSAEKGKPAVMAIVDASNKPRETFVLFRGDLNNKGPQVQAGVPRIFSPTAHFAPAKSERSTGQRLALADWIVAPENPIAWRVIANRLWHHHFGRGIVATPSNFGVTGSLPTHPELLDYLAIEMAATGGQWKTMHRQLMTSATYRQASQGNGRGNESDPQNLLLWRMNKRRLEAEAIRDNVLAIAGTLNAREGGPGVKPRIPAELLAASQRNKWPVVKNEGPEHWRRSVYIYVKRQMPFPLLELFDVPSTANTCDRRQDSTIPTQALVLMNDEFTQEQARWFARRVLSSVKEGSADDQARVALRFALSRDPSATRIAEAADFLQAQKSDYQNSGRQAAEATEAAVADLCHVLLNCNELLYVD
ncbi:PSD1 and planctomycete cytochrome C domain-containing protein [Anatilimnocola floriformis]|uniref:PSD1 and planctomycete cytochrome C domain-containing protein n=1 Tax=Anatilimnocola floriformis TaxID=2948575 RepID=UPI0020C32E3E|nr:PSD1 and planctomycete cytochrome C domain-containing protein [Anatilimnocola floriformis]